MSFRTALEVHQSESQIRYDSNLLFIGSCFSVEIGKKLSSLKYNVLQNPAGITFNPKSILTTIRACTSGNSLPEQDFFFHNGLWKNSNFHGSFNHLDRDLCADNANKSISEAYKYISSISQLVITLGSAYIYEDKKTGHVVNNCHKRPPQDFSKRLMTIPEITQDIKDIIDIMSNAAPELKSCIITVSPVRHVKDGIIENQRSKSRLIEATHTIIDHNSKVSYFPAYELLLDDLRDYRFYNRDLVHPSEEAVDYIYEKFENAYLDNKDAALRRRIDKINKRLSHRTQFPNTESHKTFINQSIELMESAMKDYPWLSFENEIAHLISQYR